MTINDLIDELRAMAQRYGGDTPVVIFHVGGGTEVSLPLQRATTTAGGPATVVGLALTPEYGTTWATDEHPDADLGGSAA